MKAKYYFTASCILFLFQAMGIHASNTFKLIENNAGASIYYAGSEQVIKTALEMLIEDSKLVCKQPFARTGEISENTVIVGIPEKEALLKDFAAKCKIDISDLTRKWEAYKIIKATDNGKEYLFVLGSDPRGTAYGLLELSRRIGVSPWVWWADVIPEKQENVTITLEGKVHAPSVQFRGIFLNDEDWALMPWASKTFEPTPPRGDKHIIGPRTYSKIFELLLRLRANILCPAMHECTVPFYLVEGNKEAAEKYGIIISTSHAEPMMCANTGEWNTKQYGDFNYFTNKNAILSYWEKRVEALQNSENIYTTGLRGIHDGRMQGVSGVDEETRTLEDVISEQRKILQKHHPGKKISDIPQIFVPYKEVLKAYNNNLQLPEDITLVWCDDNHGYLMRLSDMKEQKRSGGAGVYYHVSYWGKPHDYLWLASTQPALIYTEMKRAWDYGSRRYWALNVGDIKPGEYLTEFFLDLAWDIHSISSHTIYEHQQKWIDATFKNVPDKESVNYILEQYYRLSGERKPEHMGFNRVEEWNLRGKLANEYDNQYALAPINDTEYSPFYFGDEIEQRIAAYNAIAGMSDTIYNRLSPDLKAAYFQLVHYPVKAAAAMNRKLLYAQKARLYARYNLPVAEEYGRKATTAYNEIAALDYTYNKDMLRGKWDGMMDMKPRNLPVFREPVLPAFKTGKGSGALLWIENATEPTDSESSRLPCFTKGAKESFFITIHPKSTASVQWNVVENSGLVNIEEILSDMLYEKRLNISLKNENQEAGTFRLNINGETYTFSVRVRDGGNLSKHTERNQMISLNASDYTNTVSLEAIQGLGHSGNAIKLPAVKKISLKAPHLEYTVFTKSAGKVKMKTGTVFRYPATPKNDLRYAIVIDNQEPQVVSVKSDFLSGKWAADVLRNQCLTESICNINKPGKHTIKLYALDEELVFDQIMMDFDLDRKHYIIPSNQ